MTLTAPIENTPDGWSARAQLPTEAEACGWTEESQTARLAKVTAALAPEHNEGLLDYGCGTGRLAAFVAYSEAIYIGFDWAPGMIARARSEHPFNHFQDWEPLGSFDLVACVGCFNLPGAKQDTWHTVRRLWERTRRALVVSLYAGTDERCLIYTEAECDRFARGESFYSTVERWRPNDILLTLHRRCPW